MNIWIDDIRKKPSDMFDTVCKNYKQTIAVLAKNKDNIGIISFDHDLVFSKSGYEIAKYIVRNNIHIDKFHIHSMNPVGAYNIRRLLSHYGYTETKTICSTSS